jgi:hypothetical protein
MNMRHERTQRHPGTVLSAIAVFALIALPALAQEPASADAEVLTATEILEDLPPEFRAGQSPPPELPSTPKPVGPKSTDRKRPSILVLPVELPEPGQSVHLRARANDLSGIDAVTLWIDDSGEGDYRAMPMKRGGDDVYEIELPPEIQAAERVTYYFEARDVPQNVQRSGSVEQPYLLVFHASAAGSGEPLLNTQRALVIAAGIVVVTLILGFVVFRVRQQHEIDREFWFELLAPLTFKQGQELTAALQEFCEKAHMHPERGSVRLSNEQALYLLGLMRQPEYQRERNSAIESRKETVRAQATQKASQESERQAARVQMFWLELLVPVVGLSDDQVDVLLDDLTGKPLIHPVDGVRTFDRRTLEKHLAWAERVDPVEVFEQWKRLDPGAERTPGGQVPAAMLAQHAASTAPTLHGSIATSASTPTSTTSETRPR